MSIISILYLIVFLIAVIVGAVRQEYKNGPYWFFIAFSLIGFTIVGIPLVSGAR